MYAIEIDTELHDITPTILLGDDVSIGERIKLKVVDSRNIELTNVPQVNERHVVKTKEEGSNSEFSDSQTNDNTPEDVNDTGNYSSGTEDDYCGAINSISVKELNIRNNSVKLAKKDNFLVKCLKDGINGFNNLKFELSREPDDVFEYESTRRNGSFTDDSIPLASTSINYNIKYKKLNYRQVELQINKHYFDINHKYSSALDILASYLKGHKFIYLESKFYAEQKLNYLMLPAILLSTIATVLSSVVKIYAWGTILISSVNGLIAFLLALVNYFKLANFFQRLAKAVPSERISFFGAVLRTGLEA